MVYYKPFKALFL